MITYLGLTPSLVLVFIRVTTIFMTVPGFSNARVPMRIRLYIALAMISIIAPVIPAPAATMNVDLLSAQMANYAAGEFVTGLIIGLTARLAFHTIEIAGTIISASINLSNSFGVQLDNTEAIPSIAVFLSLSATILIMQSGLLDAILIGMKASFQRWPLGRLPGGAFGLSLIVDAIVATFISAVAISSPFLVYALITNVALGLLNRLIQQIPVFFAGMPLVMLIGLYILLLAIVPMSAKFFQTMTEALR